MLVDLRKKYDKIRLENRVFFIGRFQVKFRLSAFVSSVNVQVSCGAKANLSSKIIETGKWRQFRFTIPSHLFWD